MGIPNIIFPYSFLTKSRAGPLEFVAKSNRDFPDISISLFSVALSWKAMSLIRNSLLQGSTSGTKNFIVSCYITYRYSCSRVTPRFSGRSKPSTFAFSIARFSFVSNCSKNLTSHEDLSGSNFPRCSEKKSYRQALCPRRAAMSSRLFITSSGRTSSKSSFIIRKGGCYFGLIPPKIWTD